LTDDIYLFDSVTGTNQRVSLSTFGFPANYLNSGITSMPSNRFPSISGNGRYVLFSTDASGTGSLVFNGSNQLPADTNNNREIILRDRKISSLARPIINVDMLFPTGHLSHNFAPNAQMPIVVQIDYNRTDLGFGIFIPKWSSR
jgi:hypothetical protein